LLHSTGPTQRIKNCYDFYMGKLASIVNAHLPLNQSQTQLPGKVGSKRISPGNPKSG